jgi:hypothetical protein
MKISFLNRFSKSTQISSFIKIRLVETELSNSSGRTDGQKNRHDEVNSRFS